ncbi:YibE/F family protein [Butyrivibrio sp. MC2013]|uniref:YibE/F family protein n=1 Tax=Butyrivibrio sp. MC2013 TaxID=1280686 RepID=UPI0003F913A6|nr:YibE/F family protein [Butyrivibrio sp. MC2013]
MDKVKRYLAAGAFVLIMVLIMIYASKDRPRYTMSEDSGTEYETARVLTLVEDKTVVDEQTENVKKGSTVLDIEILTGRYKGRRERVTNYYSALYNVDVAEGDTVSVRIDTTGVDQIDVSIYNYDRIPFFFGMIGAFLLVLLLIGGRQGLKAFGGLVFTVLCIVFILLPLALKGYETVPLTCFIILITSAACFYLIGGLQVKTVSAALGSFGGVVIAAVFGALAGRIGGVTVFQTDEAEALLLQASTFPMHLRGLLVSSVLIAAMGAVMDVAMTIASALDEIHRLGPKRSEKELFLSGMKIGRDAMGTMANTLVLAYVGSALNMLVLIYSYGVSFIQLVNTDFVAIELIRAVSGSIGIFATVPVVSGISAFLECKAAGKK